MVDKVAKSSEGDEGAFIGCFLFKQICMFSWKKIENALAFLTFCRPLLL